MNPFHYGTPAQGEHFTGRRAELAALTARMRDGINVVLVSPRRYGKTSLIRTASAALRAGRPAAAIVEANVLREASPARFAGALTSGAYRLPGARWQRARQAVPEFARRLRLQPSVSFDAAGQPRFGFDAGLQPTDLATVVADVYALLGEVATDRGAALVVDEFQDVDLVGADLPFLLKGLADEHPQVSLVLAGSKRHLMERMVADRDAPLFGMAQRVGLGPIPDDEMVEYLVGRASAGGRPMAERVARRLVDLAGPAPNDIQHLAYDAFEAATRRIDDEALDAGMARAVAHDATLFADAVGRLSAGQLRVLVALAVEPPEQPYSSAFARRVGLASGSSVRRALEPLREADDVIEVAGRLRVADPFLRAWLADRT